MSGSNRQYDPQTLSTRPTRYEQQDEGWQTAQRQGGAQQQANVNDWRAERAQLLGPYGMQGSSGYPPADERSQPRQDYDASWHSDWQGSAARMQGAGRWPTGQYGDAYGNWRPQGAYAGPGSSYGGYSPSDYGAAQGAYGGPGSPYRQSGYEASPTGFAGGQHHAQAWQPTQHAQWGQNPGGWQHSRGGPQQGTWQGPGSGQSYGSHAMGSMGRQYAGSSPNAQWGAVHRDGDAFGYGPGSLYGGPSDSGLFRTPAGRMQQQRRGPKGWQRSDERIREDLCERLYNRDDLDSSDVAVEVRDGRVVLEGSVNDRWQKHALEDLADSLPGVKEVENRVRVYRSATDGGLAAERPSGYGTSAGASNESPGMGAGPAGTTASRSRDKDKD